MLRGKARRTRRTRYDAPVTDTLPDTIAADTIAASAGKVSVPSIETLPETIAAETIAASAGKVSSPVTDTLPDTIAADTIAAPTKNPAHGRVWFDINRAE